MTHLRNVLTSVVPLLFALSACAPSDDNGTPMTLGGMPAFEADLAWPTTPADWNWGQVIGIYADSRGHVWTSSGSRISEWDGAGNLLQSWSARGPEGNWSTIHGLFVDHNDYVWTTARESDLVLKFTREGEVVLTVGTFGESGGSNDTELMGRPAEIWVDPATNEAYIADGYVNRRVIVIDGETGRYLRHWGAYGARPDDEWRRDPMSSEPPQQFQTVHGITGSRDGLIYVADRANNRVQVFQKDGTFVMENILRPRCAPQGQPAVPGCATEAAFSIGFSHDEAQEFLYVADGGSHKVLVLRRSDLQIVDEIGGPGVGPGQFGRPHNLTVDPSGNIYVAEAAGPSVPNPMGGENVNAGYRVQKLTFSGVTNP